MKILFFIAIISFLQVNAFSQSAYTSQFTGGFIDTTLIDIHNNFTFDGDTLALNRKRLWLKEEDFRDYWKTHWYSEDAYKQSQNFFGTSVISAWGANVFGNIIDDLHRNRISSAYYGNNNVAVMTYMGGDTLFPAYPLFNKMRINPDAGSVLETAQGTQVLMNVNKLELAGNNLPTTFTEFVLSENSIQEFNTTGDVNLTTTDLVGYRFRFNGTAHRYSYRYIYGFYSNLSDFSASSHIYTGAYHFYGKGNQPAYFGGGVNANAGYNFFVDTQASDTYVLTIAGITSYIAGLEITFDANTANTDGATVNVNGLGAKALTKCSAGAINTALTTGDIIAGQIVKAVYDGTQFQVISRLAQ